MSKTSQANAVTIGFVGAGNMAQAIASGMLESGLVQPSQLVVSAPSENNLGFWRGKGVEATHSNAYVIKKCNIIILGMKPQYLDEAIKTFEPAPVNKLFVSILAGVTIQQLNEKLRTQFNFKGTGPEPWRVVRTMPNTPMMVGAGVTAYAVSESVTAEESQLIEKIFSTGGLCVSVPERLLNPVGALSGSGPAYVYLIIEGLSDGAVKQGVPRALATQLACQTVVGGAKMVQTTGRHPGQLKDEVCSPGGTTITAIHALEQHGVRAALIAAIEAATKRSNELGSK